jgi:hypothetical protein
VRQHAFDEVVSRRGLKFVLPGEVLHSPGFGTLLAIYSLRQNITISRRIAG